MRIDVEDASRNGNPAHPWTGPDDCCSAAKVDALERALIGADGWITGIRREQSPTRADAQFVEHDDARGIWKYNPLADWTEQDLWREIHARDLLITGSRPSGAGAPAAGAPKNGKSKAPQPALAFEGGEELPF